MLNLGILVFHGMISAQLPGNLTMLQYSTVNTGSFMTNKEFVPPPNALLNAEPSTQPWALSVLARSFVDSNQITARHWYR